MSIPGGVGWTALVVAAQRAAESRRPDALFRDPLAEALVDRVGEGTEGGTADDGLPPLRTDDTGRASAMTRMMGDYLPIRTRFLDDRLLAAAADGIDQVVVLAAGLDGRAFRLDWPAGTRVFEIDVAEVLGFKDTVAARLSPTAARTAIAVDLRDDWPTALTAAGHDPSRRTVWLAEGLLIYLSADANDLLVDRVGALSAPGSRLLTEYSDGDPSGPMTADAAPAGIDDDPALTLFRDLVDAGPRAEPHAWLSGRGWTVRVTTLADAAPSTGRVAPAIMDAARGGAAAWFVEAVRGT